MNKKNNERLDYKKLNDVLTLGKNILKILLVAIIVVGIYVILMVLKELKIVNIILSILSILSPLFIGIVIAWLLNPVVNFLEKNGIKRLIGITISYILLFLILALIVSALIPIIYDQIIEFSNSIPGVTNSLHNMINSVFDKLANIDFIDVEVVKSKMYDAIAGYGTKLSDSLPNMLVNGILTLVSYVGTCLIGLVIGFFMLLSFNNITDTFLILLPERFHKNAQVLLTNINKALRAYVNGALFDATIIFVACSIAFALVGLKAPILFALFCGLMNVIPYAGPYIGAVPALIVAFTQGGSVGVGAAVSIIIIQMLEGNILSPIVMSKTTKLHPVSIILGLLVFGHFFGIIGMLLSTPIIGVLKCIFEFIDNKYHIFRDGDNNEES